MEEQTSEATAVTGLTLYAITITYSDKKLTMEKFLQNIPKRFIKKYKKHIVCLYHCNNKIEYRDHCHGILRVDESVKHAIEQYCKRYFGYVTITPCPTYHGWMDYIRHHKYYTPYEI